jgi:amino acid transporter
MGANRQETGLARGIVGSARVTAFGTSIVAPAASVITALVIVISYAGFASPLVVLITFAASLCCALSIAEFARRVPSAGWTYTYNNRGLGQTAGFLTGWMMIFGYTMFVPGGIALTSIYASHLLPPYPRRCHRMPGGAHPAARAPPDLHLRRRASLRVSVCSGWARGGAGLPHREHRGHPRVPHRVPRRIQLLAASAYPGYGCGAFLVPPVGHCSPTCLHPGEPPSLRRARLARPRCHRRRRLQGSAARQLPDAGQRIHAS